MYLGKRQGCKKRGRRGPSDEKNKVQKAGSINTGMENYLGGTDQAILTRAGERMKFLFQVRTKHGWERGMSHMIHLQNVIIFITCNRDIVSYLHV